MVRLEDHEGFMRRSAAITPWLAGLFVTLAVTGLSFGFFGSPEDYQQGQSVRIMYVHVPCAWIGMFCYTIMAVASGVALFFKKRLADLVARSAAPIGATFTFLTLVTGSLWGKPMWGTWWVWDARLTSVLVLFFLYLGYLALINAFDDPARGAKAGAILALVGFVNVPLIKFSVDWWNTLHQQSIIKAQGGLTVHASMAIPLFIMVAAFTTFMVWMLLERMRAEIISGEIRALRLRQVHGQAAD
jgi:heme exporter protein C